jgi:ABC-type polysaccharide/polyol phosphate transport system ATPase subunit
MRSALARPGAAPPGADLEPGILAEGISKQYPGRRVLMFPPVLSIFERDLFGTRRSAAQADTRTPLYPSAGYDVGDDDDDLDDEDDTRDSGIEDALPPPRARPDEMFWALKDVSLRVDPGSALGVLGGQGAGKSTLLRILSGRAFPTEGRVRVRGRVAPLPAELQKALSVSGKHGDDLLQACRLLGVEPHLVKQHKDEIEDLAGPLTTPDGDPVRGARIRLAMATTAVLPASVILIEETRGLDDAFTARLSDRLRERLRSGTSVVLASRRAEFVRELCDEVIVLHEGEIVERGDASQTAVKGRRARGRSEAAISEGRLLVDGPSLSVPPPVAPFNERAALLYAEMRAAKGERSKRLDAADELVVEIRLETAVPGTEVLCGVSFTPRGGGSGLRLELPEPVRLADPRTYVLVARIPPGTLRGGGYAVHADALIAGGDAEPSAIARAIGRVRIDGEELPAADAGEPPAQHWDGRAAWPVEAKWSIK